MSYQEIKTKSFRRQITKTFFYMFLPQIVLCLFFTFITENVNRMLTFQFIWFSIYTTVFILLYVLAPKIYKKTNNHI